MIDYNIIATGSKGNAVVIDQKILIDCGVSFKALSKVYRALKLVLLTHIHSDHFQPTTLRLLAENRPTLRFACCAWLCKPLVDAGVPVSQIDVLEPGHMYGYGICNVRPDMVNHAVVADLRLGRQPLSVIVVLGTAGSNVHLGIRPGVCPLVIQPFGQTLEGSANIGNFHGLLLYHS